MLKINQLLIVLIIFLSLHAKADEVTDQEYTSYGALIATYYRAGASGVAECTAFNQLGKPIGGGVGVFTGSVARVRIDLPEKYVGTLLDVRCE